jgi:hypothetical protein
VSGVSKELSLLVLGDRASSPGDHGGVDGGVSIDMGDERVAMISKGFTDDGFVFFPLMGRSMVAAPSREVVGGVERLEENEPGTSQIQS